MEGEGREVQKKGIMEKKRGEKEREWEKKTETEKEGMMGTMMRTDLRKRTCTTKYIHNTRAHMDPLTNLACTLQLLSTQRERDDRRGESGIWVNENTQ